LPILLCEISIEGIYVFLWNDTTQSLGRFPKKSHALKHGPS
jgi:hypothetical protein